ncbi:hypothetical protein V8B97DRAFT_2016820 [Scleroderma yunnanense]
MRSIVLFVASLAVFVRAPVPKQVLSAQASSAQPTDTSTVDPNPATASVLARAAVPRQVFPSDISSVQPTDTATLNTSAQLTNSATLGPDATDTSPQSTDTSIPDTDDPDAATVLVRAVAQCQVLPTDTSAIQPTDTPALDTSAQPTDSATLDPNATNSGAQSTDTPTLDPNDPDAATVTALARAAVARQVNPTDESSVQPTDTLAQPTDSATLDPNATDTAGQPTDTSDPDPNDPDAASATALARAAVPRQELPTGESSVQPTDTSTLDSNASDSATPTALVLTAAPRQAPTQDPAAQPTDASATDSNTVDPEVASEPIGTDGVLTTTANAAVNSAPYTVPVNPATFFWTSTSIIPGVGYPPASVPPAVALTMIVFPATSGYAKDLTRE